MNQDDTTTRRDSPLEFSYGIDLVDQGTSVALSIPELGIAASGEDIGTAYAALKRKRRDFFARVEAGDFLIELPPPRRPVRARRRGLRPSTIFVCTALVLAVAFLTKEAASFAESAVRILYFPDTTMMPRLAQVDDRLVNMPNERKAEIQEHLRSIVLALAPFLAESHQCAAHEPVGAARDAAK